MKRLFFSVVVAAAFGALTYFAGDYLYTMERIQIDASDSEGTDRITILRSGVEPSAPASRHVAWSSPA